jgi:hypothetical protein
MSTFTLKISTLYAACSPELGVVSYGRCQDEALNNLTDEIRQRSPPPRGTAATVANSSGRTNTTGAESEAPYFVAPPSPPARQELQIP